MRTSKLIQCIDTHSCGEPTRVVLSGIPPVMGKTMKEKYSYFKNNYDNLRTTLFQEPRGFDNMLGVFVVEPTLDGADFGAIYASATQYFEMCGDSTFSLTEALIETGMVKATEPATRISLDTYGGIVAVEAQVNQGLVGDITYRSVPSFFLKTVEFDVPNLGTVTADVAFGGMWYAFVEASKVNIEIAPRNMKRILALGMTLLNEINNQVKVEHPQDPKLSSVTLITFYERNPKKGIDYKTANVYGDNATCRSPAGTMSAARAAISYGKGELSKGCSIAIENGWIESKHIATVADETTIGHLPGIIPKLSATAYITGMYQAIVDPDDPYREGFILLEDNKR